MDNGIETATLSPSSASFDQRLQLPASCDPPGPQNPAQQRVWVIFGATGHMGRSIVKAALSHGDLVTAVGRVFQDTIPSMQDLQPPSLSPGHQAAASPDPRSPYLPLLCDVRVRETVDAVFQTSLAHWGRIDIITNASGYGVIGSCEDQDDFDIRNQFETNFWGTLHILQLSLPYFRSKSSGGGSGGGSGGRYLILSSTGGSLGVPGLGPYCATKYAVEGLIESMLYETAAFDIRATLVEPGHVRRDDPHPSSGGTHNNNQQSHHHPHHKSSNLSNPLPTFGHFSIKPPTPPYASSTSPSSHALRVLAWLSGSGSNSHPGRQRQPTSAIKAAELIWQLAHCRFPPLRLLLGGFAVESVRDRVRGVMEEVEEWKGLSFRPEGEGERGGGGRREQGDGEDQEGEEEEEEEEEDEEEEEEGEEQEDDDGDDEGGAGGFKMEEDHK